MNVLPPIAYVLAGVGITGGIAFAGAIVWDVLLARSGQQTISEWFLAMSTGGQILVMAIVAAFGIIWGGLWGHLEWPSDGSGAFWFKGLLVLFVAFLAGGWIGHHFFGQTQIQARQRRFR